MGDVEPITGRIRLHPGPHPRLSAGHLWVYDSEIAEVQGTPEVGDVVDVTHGDRLIGRGLFNPRSKIRVRLLTRGAVTIDDAFWLGRIRDAIALRARVVSGTTAFRLVHGESDALPGLIVDRYAGVLAMQALSAGIERRKEALAGWLREVTGADAVYLRNDAKALAREGLAPAAGFLAGSAPTEVEIEESGARFVVDLVHGQKTGWYCDQRENRLAVATLTRDADVLDVCSHTGAFAVHAARAGARRVTAMDVSADALERAQAHAALNGVGACLTVEMSDAFDGLRRLHREDRRYDLVILDPPAFARAKAAVPHALTGYEDLNRRAMQVLTAGGLLVSCSCSHYVSDSQLWTAILTAARDVRREVRLLETRGQARDHPILGSMPETRYLKCFILQIV